jgi:hypothetical protein
MYYSVLIPSSLTERDEAASLFFPPAEFSYLLLFYSHRRKERERRAGEKRRCFFPLFIFVTMVLNPGPCAFKTNTLPWSYVSSPVLWF